MGERKEIRKKIMEGKREGRKEVTEGRKRGGGILIP
jgi:hypothetical protein